MIRNVFMHKADAVADTPTPRILCVDNTTLHVLPGITCLPCILCAQATRAEGCISFTFRDESPTVSW